MERLAWKHLCETDATGIHSEGSNAQLLTWYAPRTLAQLRYLWKVVEEVPEPERAILELLFSDILFNCASPGRTTTSTGKKRKHHWGWVADNVRPVVPVEHDAILAFHKRLLDEVDDQCPERGDSVSSIVVQQDARKLGLLGASVDLVVTSPPYVGVIDYTRANRLMYLWKGWAFDADRAKEIGARYKRGRTKIQHEYISDMRACWDELNRVLRPGGYCAVVLGESRIFPGTVDQTLNDLKNIMPMVWGPIPRVATRRRVSDRQATESVEFVSVFQKP